ncbi:hypothetical protein [Candidatus Methylacidithermus pantelleriae]|uniref:hypothetical protein n=1 Tax=Candidatus Methylacidithermus pantelleriae TaxID=2744239 RepID=UPI00157DEB13|nr:hypothetical protein [Candidatus Methylacidithermus pantelleriae]
MSFLWGVRGRRKAAQGAHARVGGEQRPPAPLSPKNAGRDATWALPVKPRDANRAATLFGRHPGRSSLVGGWLSMVLGKRSMSGAVTLAFAYTRCVRRGKLSFCVLSFEMDRLGLGLA